MSDEDMAAFKRPHHGQDEWPPRTRSPRTPGELTARLDPELARTITASVLLVTGDKSADASKADIDTVAASLRDARFLVLEDQEHVADVLDPALFAGGFCRS